MQGKANICIINEHQIAANNGGVQTVSYLLQEKLEELGYTVYSFHLEQNGISNEKEFILPDKEKVDSRINFEFLHYRITKHNISIIFFQGYTKELMNLCINVRKELPVKLIFTYHRNPHASIKEYDDYKEKILNNTNTFIGKIVKDLWLEAKRLRYNQRAKHETKKNMSTYEIRYIDAFVSLDKQYTEYIKSLYPKEFHHKFHTIINPIKLVKSKESYKKEKSVLFIARHTYQKRLDRLLYIWRETYKEFPEWKLTIVGDGEYHQNYVETAKRLKLANVEFVGKQVATQYYKSNSIVCVTSSHEGLPMTLIEAQVFGCVPIAYNSFSSAKEIIIHNYNGLLITPFRQNEYTKALHEIMKDDQKRAKMASNGLKYIQKFDIDNVIKEWLSLLKKI